MVTTENSISKAAFPDGLTPEGAKPGIPIEKPEIREIPNMPPRRMPERVPQRDPVRTPEPAKTPVPAR